MWRDRGYEGMQNVCCVPVTLRLASVTDKLSWLTRNLTFLSNTHICISSFQKVSIPEASVATGSLLDLQILGSLPRMTDSELGLGAANSLCCNKPPGGAETPSNWAPPLFLAHVTVYWRYSAGDLQEFKTQTQKDPSLPASAPAQPFPIALIRPWVCSSERHSLVWRSESNFHVHPPPWPNLR